MDKIDFVKVTDLEGVEVKHAIIDHGNGEYTSMLKSTYDAQLAAQDTLPSKLAEKPSV